MYSRILVPLDGTDHSETILPHATELAQKFAATLVLLRVTMSRGEALRQTVSPEPMAAAPISLDVADSLVDAQDEAAGRYLAGVRQRLESSGVSCETVVVEGNTTITLPEVVKQQRIELVAMATHGRAGLSRFFLGSVADSLLHDVHIPVLLLNSEGQG